MTLCAGCAHSEAVLIGWARENVPEFSDVLWRKAKLTAIPVQIFQRLPRNRADGVVILDGAK